MADDHREAIRLLVFAASLRANSLNSRLADLASRVIDNLGGTVVRARMADFECPSYNQDVQDGAGFPDGAVEFYARLQACDGFVIASPEYNASMPGLLKNAIDWASRFRPQPFHQRHGLLMSASPSMAGGNRGLWSLRIPLEHLGARVYPEMFSLALAHRAFDDDGRIADTGLGDRFEQVILGFLDLVEAARHYPCIKRAWIEFPGERAD